MEEKIKFQNEKYAEKIKIVNEFLINNFNNMDLLKFLSSRNWKENNELCLRIINDSLYKEDIDYLNQKLNLFHLKDKRTPQEYACDLILGWVIEDAVYDLLKEIGAEPKLESGDKLREFLRRPAASPDLKIRTGNSFVKLELVEDFTGYWKKNERIELRDNKYDNIKKEHGIILGLDFKEKRFFLLPAENSEAKKIESHWPYGGKPAYSINLEKVNWFDLKNMRPILTELFKLCKTSQSSE